MHFGFPRRHRQEFIYIHPLFTVRWQIGSISEANNRRLQTQQCPIGQVFAVEDLTPERRQPELQRERRSVKKTSAFIERPKLSPSKSG